MDWEVNMKNDIQNIFGSTMARSMEGMANVFKNANMTPEEISDLFRKVKLYVDFGNFPGPERLPKEAVYNGVNNLRYIDKILFEWNKKGYKKSEDIVRSKNSKDDDYIEEIYDYDWLNEE